MSIVPPVPLNYVLAAYAFLKTRGGEDAELAELLMEEAVRADMRRRIAKAVSNSYREIGYAISVSDLGSVRDKCKYPMRGGTVEKRRCDSNAF